MFSWFVEWTKLKYRMDPFVTHPAGLGKLCKYPKDQRVGSFRVAKDAATGAFPKCPPFRRTPYFPLHNNCRKARHEPHRRAEMISATRADTLSNLSHHLRKHIVGCGQSCAREHGQWHVSSSPNHSFPSAPTSVNHRHFCTAASPLSLWWFSLLPTRAFNRLIDVRIVRLKLCAFSGSF